MAWLMVLVVVGAAALFTFSGFLAEEMSGSRRFWFMVILWCYGIFRVYRLFLLHKQTS